MRHKPRTKRGLNADVSESLSNSSLDEQIPDGTLPQLRNPISEILYNLGVGIDNPCVVIKNKEHVHHAHHDLACGNPRIHCQQPVPPDGIPDPEERDQGQDCPGSREPRRQFGQHKIG